MTMPLRRNAIRYGSTMLILAALLGVSSLASAGSNKTSAPAKSAPAPKAAPAAKSSGVGAGAHGTGASGGAGHGVGSGGVSHGPTANGSHGPSANGTASHGPTANGAGSSHGVGATTAYAHSTSSVGGYRTSGPIAHAAPRGSVDHVANNGSAVRMRPNGRVSDVHDVKRGMEVHNGLNGNRRAFTERPDHSRVVSERGRPGYVQHPYGFHGHDYGRRTYFYHGHAYGRFYRGHYYRGVYMNVYAPGYYYGPGFYGWAYNPWGVPVAYGWGWGGSPWYGYYGYYFAPYPVYSSASYWLTDYMISSDLQASYAARQEAGEVDGAPPVVDGSSAPPMMTPDVKQQIADEIRAQLALESQEAVKNSLGQDADPVSSGIARMIGDGRPHVFVAGSDLDVIDASGQECTISDGDALQMKTPPASDASAADLVVLSSKGGHECQRAATVTVSLNDLQEMQNHMRETIDQGLKDLQARQGKGGLPSLPPSAQVPTTPALYAAAAPADDPNAAAAIQQQMQSADESLKEVSTTVAQDNGTAPPAAEPAPIAIGQTQDQVKSALGAPARVANLGPKSIYYYDGTKVIFQNGKVSDIQHQ